MSLLWKVVKQYLDFLFFVYRLYLISIRISYGLTSRHNFTSKELSLIFSNWFSFMFKKSNVFFSQFCCVFALSSTMSHISLLHILSQSVCLSKYLRCTVCLPWKSFNFLFNLSLNKMGIISRLLIFRITRRSKFLWFFLWIPLKHLTLSKITH